jgi:hypothetical protein
MRKVVTMRLEEEIVDDLRDWAKAEGRSLANLMESWWRRERDRRLGSEVTLNVLDDKLDRVMGLIESLKKKKSSEPKLTAMDVDLCGVIDEDSWKEWVGHLRMMGVYPNHYHAQGMVKQLVDLDKDGWDCEILLKELAEGRAKSVYIPVKLQRANK